MKLPRSACSVTSGTVW